MNIEKKNTEKNTEKFTEKKYINVCLLTYWCIKLNVKILLGSICFYSIICIFTIQIQLVVKKREIKTGGFMRVRFQFGTIVH